MRTLLAAFLLAPALVLGQVTLYSKHFESPPLNCTGGDQVIISAVNWAGTAITLRGATFSHALTTPGWWNYAFLGALNVPAPSDLLSGKLFGGGIAPLVPYSYPLGMPFPVNGEIHLHTACGAGQQIGTATIFYTVP